MVEVAYNYASPTTQVIAGSYNMTNQFYTKPRRVGQIPAPIFAVPSLDVAAGGSVLPAPPRQPASRRV